MTKTLLHETSSADGPQVPRDNEAATSDHGSIDSKMEARMRLKMDIFLIPLVSLIYLLSFIDRSNIGNAKIAGLEKDLDMHHYDFNVALSIFYISYIVFEIPSNLLCKWMGPGWFIPTTITGFGVLTVCTGLVQSFSSLCGIRFLLGIFEAGMMPSLVYYLARWYTHHELTFRVSLFIISASLAGAFGGLLASAILKLSHFGSLHSWRMIFGIEGLATVGLGLVSFAILPDRPETAIWLSPEEKLLAVSRLRAERLSKSHKTKEFNWNQVRLGIFNPIVLPTSAIFLLNSTTVHGVSFFLPTIVKTIFPHEPVRTQQLLTVPPYVLGALACALTSLWSWKIGKREIFMIFCAPLTVIGYLLFLATDNFKVRYGAVFLPFFGIFTYGALTNSHVAANVVSDTSRTAAIATNVMFGNIGGLASTWAYVDKDAPHFKIGNGLNLACQASMIIIATGLYFWRKRDNKRRDEFQRSEAAESATEADIDELDWKHPDFRWRE